jgi:thiol-disulfide isomerase/thioredoxin
VAAQERGELGIALGERPELVEIEDLQGNDVSLAQYMEGRPALIEFWARWCELCEELYPQMEEVHARYEDRVAFVAVAVAVAQSQRSVRRHLEDHPVSFPTLWDEGGRAVRAFLAPGTSYIVVLDAEGTVVYTGSGGNQDIEAAVRLGLEAGG